MTPLQLTMMLHYYAIAEPYALRQPEHAGSAAVRDQRHELVMLELLRPVCGNASGYEVTDKGRAFVDALKSTPLPVCKWIIPERAA